MLGTEDWEFEELASATFLKSSGRAVNAIVNLMMIEWLDCSKEMMLEMGENWKQAFDMRFYIPRPQPHTAR